MSFHSEILKDLERQRAELHRKYSRESDILTERQRTVEAFIKGKAIQAQSKNYLTGALGQWNSISYPHWDFNHFNYCIAPEKKWGAVFKTGGSDMDVLCGFKTTELAKEATKYLDVVTYFQHD